MSDPNTSFDARPVQRALLLGFVVFLIFVIAGGALWWLAIQAGLAKIPAFFLAACAGPLMVSGLLMLWVYVLPAERWRRLLGMGKRDAGPDV